MNSRFKQIQILIIVMLSLVFSGTVLAGQYENEKIETQQALQSITSPYEKIEVLRKLSAAGNSVATLTLCLTYINGDAASGIPLDIKESEKLAKLAIMQGNPDAYRERWLLIEPTKPYKAEIGMFKRQVLNSVYGAPDDKRTTTTESGQTEIWIYRYGAYLFFDENDRLERIHE